MWAMQSDFLPKNTVWKEQKKSDFTVETPDKHYLAQVIKVNIINDESRWQMYIWYDVMRMALLVLFSKTHDSDAIMKKKK